MVTREEGGRNRPSGIRSGGDDQWFGEGNSAGSQDSQGRREQRSSDSRPGDWQCTSCNSDNFAWRTECFRCGAAGCASDYNLESVAMP